MKGSRSERDHGSAALCFTSKTSFISLGFWPLEQKLRFTSHELMKRISKKCRSPRQHAAPGGAGRYVQI
jgi:hypothetical protein